MAYRSDVEALAARQASLQQELTAKQTELTEASRLLEDARARTRLPVLDNIRVASPCKVPWDGMTGDERVRHCGDCKKNVYNLSEMTREEAEQLIVGRTGSMCVRYFQRADGTILLGDDCAIGASRRMRRTLVAAGVIAAGLATAVGIGVRTLTAEQQSCCHHQVVQGVLATPARTITPVPEMPRTYETQRGPSYRMRLEEPGTPEVKR